MAASKSGQTPVFCMEQRSDRPDFYIRDHMVRPALTMFHRHDYFQIQINLEGDTWHYIGAIKKPFPQYSISFVLPNQVHRVEHPPAGRFFVINFSRKFLLPQLQCGDLELSEVSLQDYPELIPFVLQEQLDFVLSSAEFDLVSEITNKMFIWSSPRRFASGMMLRAELLRLLAYVCQLFSRDIEDVLLMQKPGSLQKRALRRIVDHIQKNISDPALSLNSVSRDVFITPNHVTHVLKKETGYTFTQLVRAERMRKARQELVSTDKSLKEIAMLCGFSNESYFSRCFRKLTGYAPGRYRRFFCGKSG
ncbi:AraC family transcriptional regulator [Klebsiella sp. P1CD1]|uniref:helix-turn-helix transcriptional regulator n=1 Tax=Klebsiella sp. P1CD1 TaxID=2267618 RepID=UPI000F4EFB7A|nr:AraC family transcriptional regulator [Klebsiella sp. P1CD1]AYW18953.1 AraC family transcriptional regulator [Klebsiella sp. P1CD1]